MESVEAKIIAFFVIVLTEITDLLDGYLARKRGERTDFGKLLDPFADSVSRYSFFLCFTGYHFAHGPQIPIIIVLLIFYRDATVSFIRTVAAGQQIIVSARTSGKIKAIFQAVANHIIVMSVIIQNFYSPFPDGYIAITMMVIVTIVTLWSAFDYLYGNREVLRRTSM